MLIGSSTRKNRVVKGAALTSMTVLMLLGGVSAAQAAPGGGAVGGGVGGGVTTADCEERSGGEWCRGTSGVSDPFKSKCYSNYKHNQRYHSSSVSQASSTDTQYASAGYWSQASVITGAAYTCYAYYNDEA